MGALEVPAAVAGATEGAGRVAVEGRVPTEFVVVTPGAGWLDAGWGTVQVAVGAPVAAKGAAGPPWGITNFRG